MKDGNVYIWTEGEGSVGLTSTHDAKDVAISDDGQIIVYVREIPANSFIYELWAVNTLAPLNERLLVSYAEMEALKAILEGPYANVSGKRVESDKPKFEDHFEIE